MKKVKLKEIGKIVSGATPKTSDETNFGGDIPWITPADLSGYTDKYISHGARNLTEKGYNSCSTQLMPANSIVFSSRAPIGYVAIARNPLCTNQGFKSIIPCDSVNSEYLFYQLIYLRNEIKELGTGTTFKEISGAKFGEIEVVIPSLPEQAKAVARIEELFSQLDDAEATLQKTKAQLAVYRQAVLKEAFKGYKSVTIESVTQHVTDGDHVPPPKTDSGIPFIMISNINGNFINWENTAYVGRDYYEHIDSKRKPKEGDVLYTVTGSFGTPVLIDYSKEFCFQRHIALLRPNDIIEQKYLYYALMEPNVYVQATKGATGTAQKTVGLGVLRKMSIPFTEDRSEQLRIVDDIESKLSACDNIEQNIDTTLHQVEAMRQSILKRSLIGGEQ